MRQQEQERLLHLLSTDAASGVIVNSNKLLRQAALDAPERYVYDVEITNTSTGAVTRVIEGIITTRPNVTTS